MSMLDVPINAHISSPAARKRASLVQVHARKDTRVPPRSLGGGVTSSGRCASRTTVLSDPRRAGRDPFRSLRPGRAENGRRAAGCRCSSAVSSLLLSIVQPRAGSGPPGQLWGCVYAPRSRPSPLCAIFEGPTAAATPRNVVTSARGAGGAHTKRHIYKSRGTAAPGHTQRRTYAAHAVWTARRAHDALADDGAYAGPVCSQCARTPSFLRLPTRAYVRTCPRWSRASTSHGLLL